MKEIGADANVGADDCASAENDVLCAVELGAPGNFVTCVGDDVFEFGSFRGGGWGHYEGRCCNVGKARNNCGTSAEGNRSLELEYMNAKDPAEPP